MAADNYDPLYLRGIASFNKEEFFESHEVWEKLWTRERGPSRQFYKGLIQAAVSLYYWGRGNQRGARTLFARAQTYLGDYRPRHLGLDVNAFLAAVGQCLDGLPPGNGTTALTDQAGFPRIRIDDPADSPSL